MADVDELCLIKRNKTESLWAHHEVREQSCLNFFRFTLGPFLFFLENLLYSKHQEQHSDGKIKNITRLIASILICQLAALIGSAFNSASINTWYTTINKPGFLPPNWLFPVVWTILFIMMGVSLYLVWKENIRKKAVKSALAAFAVQLVLNILWSFFFFTLRSPLLGLIEIIVLWAAILVTILRFYKVSKAAAYLLIPYILWVTFAAVLNISILFLNL